MYKKSMQNVYLKRLFKHKTILLKGVQSNRIRRLAILEFNEYKMKATVENIF